jgi:DNA-directed RNA polymerase subunit RPC12/RpoP
MSAKIGGPFRCNIHEDFQETDDVNEWNEHCKTTEGHTITGVTTCTTCGAQIELNEIPYQPIGTELKLQCPDCFDNSQDLNKLVNTQIRQAQQQTQQEPTVEGYIQQ